MKFLIVLAHHERESFNGALFQTAVAYLREQGHEVRTSDLYAMGFDPVSDRRNFKTVADSTYLKQQTEERHATAQNGFSDDILAEQEKLMWADGLILQFPLWWFSMPAILKGWVDRVFAQGTIYGGGKWYENGVFKGKRAMLSLTTGGPETMYASDGLNGDMDMLMYPINHGILRFTGYEVLPQFVAWAPAHLDDVARNGYLEQFKERLASFMETPAIEYPRLEEYDMTTFSKKKLMEA